MQEYINIKGDVKLPGNVTETTTTIKISGVELNDLDKCFSANCLQYDKLNVSNAKLNATHNIQVKNLLLDTYLEYPYLLVIRFTNSSLLVGSVLLSRTTSMIAL